jgi:hypothetical protein
MSILKKYKKILHIKIPKNGTHSINKILSNRDEWHRDYFMGHDPLYVLEENNFIDEDVFVFCVSRNPFTRFFSQYQQLVITQPDYQNKNIFDFIDDIKNKNLHPFFTAPQVEWIATKQENILPKKMSFEDKNFAFHFSYNNQKKYIINSKLTKIYKIENINEFENDFNVNLSYKNFSNYSLNYYINFFNNNSKKFILDHYSEDFYKFKYSLDFEDSIDDLRSQRKNLLFYQ